MVRAIVAGTKTQTRSVVKGMALGLLSEPIGFSPDFVAHPENDVCPYGQAGDRLWVRETWARDDEDGQLIYRADVGHDLNADMWEQNRIEGAPRFRWRPSIFMPRWASRITLDIVDIGVERLQDISEIDAAAEGAPLAMEIDGSFGRHPMGTHREGFGLVWQQINGRESWLANPWVWVVEFAVVNSAVSGERSESD